MALDATIGGANADSYGTLAEADAYFAARETGNWDGSDSNKEMALRKATDWLDLVYVGKWKGVKATSTQARAWPRYSVIDADGYSIDSETIPRNLKYAQFEAAKLIAGGTEMQTTINRAVKSEEIGEISVEYMDGATLTAMYPQVTNWLNDLVIGGSSQGGSSGSNQIVRA